jgi:ribosomal protein S27AE
MNTQGSFIGTGSPTPFPAGRESKPTAEIEELKFQVERLLITTEALWNILREKHGIEDEELARQMVMIDMRDGKLDGRVAKDPPRNCPKCGRVMAKSRPRCLYCGEPVVPEPFAR